MFVNTKLKSWDEHGLFMWLTVLLLSSYMGKDMKDKIGVLICLYVIHLLNICQTDKQYPILYLKGSPQLR